MSKAEVKRLCRGFAGPARRGAMLLFVAAGLLCPAAGARAAGIRNEGPPSDAATTPGPAKGAEFLDYGLYWFGYGGASQKALPGAANRYYDPRKPVVLFLHGVEDGSSGQGYSREAFDAAHLGFGVQAHHGWLDDGWNVGAFYWNQFADEANPLDAEAKIWTAHGPRGMRYRLNDRTYGTALAPDTPVGELLYAAFLSALAGNTSRNIRLAGHSLGAELACYLGARIMEDCRAGLISDRYMIRRIAMIEPAWSPDCRAYLGDGDGRGDSPAGRVMAALEGMVRDWGGRNGFCFEVYSSTALEYLVENPVTLLSDMAGGTVRLRLDCFRAGEIKRRHRSAYLYYFASYSFAPPPECVARGGCARPTGDFAPSAATPDARVAERTGCGEAWEQAGGTDTFTPADDWFERR